MLNTVIYLHFVKISTTLSLQKLLTAIQFNIPEQVATEDHAQHEDEEAYPKNDDIDIEWKMPGDV